jgi:hypothetical protein
MTRSHIDLEKLGSEMASSLNAEETAAAERDSLTRQRVLTRFVAARSTQRRARWPWGVGAVVGAASVAVYLFAAAPRPGTPVRAGEWVALTEGYRLDFSDGSTLRTLERYGARVLRTNERGAEVALERGRLEASVVHRDATEWKVLAGPFTIQVIGTRFTADWDPDLGRFAVTVNEGHVLVHEDGEREHHVRAGERVELRAHGTRAGETEKEENSGAAPAAPLSAASPSGEGTTLGEAGNEPDVGDPSARVPSTPTALKSDTPRLDWQTLHRAGRYGDALAAAEAKGFARLCGSLPAEDLLTLASTARLAGRSDLSRETLPKLRQRFPGSEQAAIAAFTLGRLEGGASWFQTYLDERPAGSLACEALGRILEQQSRRRDPEAPRTASRYLAACPSGAHDRLAQNVLGQQSVSGQQSVFGKQSVSGKQHVPGKR